MSTSHYPNGDAAAVRQHMLAKLLMSNDYSVSIVGINSEPKIVDGEYDSVKYTIFPNNQLYLKKYLISYLNKLDQKPDVIFLNGLPMPAFIYIKNYALDYNILLFHDCVEWYSYEQWRGFWYFDVLMFIVYIQKNIMNRLILNRAFSIISISSYLHDYFTKKNLSSLLLPVIMDKDQFNNLFPQSNNKLRIIYAGSPLRKDYLMEIIQGLLCLDLAERDNIEFTIIGLDYQNLSKICDLSVNELFELKCIQVLGKIPRIKVLEHLNCCDFSILIRSSTARYAKAGFPTKVVESLMSSTPVICNMTSDLGMYLKDGYDCIEVTDETPDAIVKALRRALALTPEQKDQMKKNARKTAEENFDYRLYIEEFGKFIKNES